MCQKNLTINCFFPLFFIGKSNRLLCLAREKLHIESRFFVGVWPCRSAVVLSSKWTWKSEHGVLGWKVRILSSKFFWIRVVLQRHTIDFTSFFFLSFWDTKYEEKETPWHYKFSKLTKFTYSEKVFQLVWISWF